MSWIDAQQWGLTWMERLARRLRGPGTAKHLATGKRGELAALFELRRRGHVIVARRWNNPKFRGDIDLVSWQQRCLCFTEVKTRTARDLTPAESAIDDAKRRTLRQLAAAYLTAFPESERRSIPVRFDVVSVYLVPGKDTCEIFENAFDWR